LGRGGHRTFTVADSVEMTRIVSSAATGDVATGDAFGLSPDGRRFFLLTRRGNLSERVNEYRLYLYEVHEVVAFLNAHSSLELPRARVLLQLEASGTEPAIGAVAWTSDGKWLTFIGRGKQNLAQVFRIDVQTGAREQLTDHPTGVVSYAQHTRNGTL
jgi:hypothetical protein